VIITDVCWQWKWDKYCLRKECYCTKYGATACFPSNWCVIVAQCVGLLPFCVLHITIITATFSPQYMPALCLHTEGWPGWVDLGGSRLHTEIIFKIVYLARLPIPVLTGPDVEKSCCCDRHRYHWGGLALWQNVGLGWRTFPVARSTFSWWVTTYVGKP